jgi:hypothetical protein
MFWIEGLLPGAGGGGGGAKAIIVQRSIEFDVEANVAHDYIMELEAAGATLLSVRAKADAPVAVSVYEGSEAQELIYVSEPQAEIFALATLPILGGAIIIRVASQEATNGSVTIRYQY